MYFHKIKNIEVLENYQLKAEFVSGEIKIYDCIPLFEKEAFKDLQNEKFFSKVVVATGGYGIVWSDDVDLSESELWINGKTVNSKVAEDKASYGAEIKPKA